MVDQQSADVILRLGRDRKLAHAALFRHRHPDPTPPFHHEMIDLWHSRIPYIAIMAFREGAKSTIAEEAICVSATFELFKNALLVGSTEKRAIERLRAIKYEWETNEALLSLFGEMKGSVWNEAEIILRNGVRILAVGRGQSLRGTKHLHYRPDFVFCDDIEEVEKGEIYSEEDALETVRWFFKVLMPAIDKRQGRVRVCGTPLGKICLPIELQKLPTWLTKTYPIEYVDEHGERQGTWAARYPLAWIDEKKDEYTRLGLYQDFMQEYMCMAEDPAAKIFVASMFEPKPRIRTWHPTFAFFDPARTAKSTSATTGWCVWSWMTNRLIIWDGGGSLWKPDEIVNQIFAVADTYSPVIIGVEQDGLHEFLMQPIRHEMVRRNHLIPVIPYKAPKGKIQFIEALQPFFLAGEAVFAKDLPVLKQQFLSFPAGRIDGPNALAYALRMRPGQVMYEDFQTQNVAENLPKFQRIPIWLALNATPMVTTGVLVQFVDGGLNVISDYVREGDPGSALESLAQAAKLDAGTDIRLTAGAVHYRDYDTVGVRGAVAKLPATLWRAGAVLDGRAEIRSLLGKQIRGAPALKVSTDARWTLNAFAAGYAREIVKGGVVSDEPREGVYRVLMEGLEAFAGLLKIGIEDEHGKVNVQVTPAGQHYISALPGSKGTQDAKSNWLPDLARGPAR